MQATATHSVVDQVIGTPRVKGSTITGAVAFIRESYTPVWGSLSPQIDALLRERAKTTAPARSAWYDLHIVVKLMALMCEAGRARGERDTQIMRRWGAYVVERDARGGLSRTLLKAMPPLAALRLYAKMWRLYEDSGKIEVTSAGPRQARLLCYGWAHPSVLVWHAVAGGVTRTLALCGVEKIEDEIVAGGKPDDHYLELALRWG